MENANDPPSLADILDRSVRVRKVLAATDIRHRERGIAAMAVALKAAFQDILEANTLDLEASRQIEISDLLLEWLKLTPERLQRYIDLLDRLGELPAVMGSNCASGRADGRQSYTQVKPLGTIAFLYEALPQLAILVAGMSIKTGNSLILRGGAEAQHSNLAIFTALKIGLERADLPSEAIQFVDASPSVAYSLLTNTKQVNLAIAYGRPSSTQQATLQATVPILPAAIGNCYLYWGANGDLDLVRHAICDSHVGEPDAVNAIEKVLIHADRQPASLTLLWKNLKDKGFQLRGDRELVATYGDYLRFAPDAEWQQPYLRKIVAFKIVESLDVAVATIDRFSNGHADCIITDSYLEIQQFVAGVKSANIYINTSPRFYRHQRGTDRLWLGMSSAGGARAGAIGLSSLLGTQQAIVG